MAQSSHGLHHFHRRKRIHKLHELYPTKDPLKRFMDKAIYVVGVFGPLMTIPQVIKIWGDKTAAGVSLLSWVSYLFVAVFWVVYGVMHKEKPIIITYSTWIILEIMVVAGIILYG